MPISRFAVAWVAAVAAFGLPAAVPAARAAGVEMAADGGVAVHEAWARASAGAATTGAVYVMLMGGDRADTLVGASTPIADSAEVHESIDDNGVMKMRSVAGVPVPAHGMVTFSPGGYHIMLVGLKRPLAAGQSFPLMLRFAHAAPITVDVTVRGMGHGTPTDDHSHMKM